MRTSLPGGCRGIFGYCPPDNKTLSDGLISRRGYPKVEHPLIIS